jgi:hypothetical protein
VLVKPPSFKVLPSCPAFANPTLEVSNPNSDPPRSSDSCCLYRPLQGAATSHQPGGRSRSAFFNASSCLASNPFRATNLTCGTRGLIDGSVVRHGSRVSGRIRALFSNGGIGLVSYSACRLDGRGIDCRESATILGCAPLTPVRLD